MRGVVAMAKQSNDEADCCRECDQPLGAGYLCDECDQLEVTVA